MHLFLYSIMYKQINNKVKVTCTFIYLLCDIENNLAIYFFI